VTTYREREETRADRLDEWADGREAKAEQSSDTARAMFGAIPFGQPIHVGHHSERTDRNYRARAGAHMDRAIDHARTADAHRSKAANIRAAAERAIYDDDPDAVERLTEKLAGLEAEREQIKAYNKSARWHAEPGPLDRASAGPTSRAATRHARRTRADRSCATSWRTCPGRSRPRDRIARLSAPRSSALAGRLMAARFGGVHRVRRPIEKGETIRYIRGEGAQPRPPRQRHD
jgi:hypothetical protein